MFSDLSHIHSVTNQYFLTINSLNTVLAVNHSQYLQLSRCKLNFRNSSLSAFSNSHSAARQFQHSSNVECSKIVQNLPEFELEFELCHIPSQCPAVQGDTKSRSYVLPVHVHPFCVVFLI